MLRSNKCNIKPFILLADTTVLYSGLVYNGLENKVLKSGKYVFVTTEFTIAELYWLLTTKRNMSRKDAIAIIKSIPLIVVKFNFFRHKWKEAFGIIGQRDKSDVPLVALALSFSEHDGIWSTDKDFQVVKHKFKIWKTRDLI